jgi:hypothetical protein
MSIENHRGKTRAKAAQVAKGSTMTPKKKAHRKWRASPRLRRFGNSLISGPDDGAWLDREVGTTASQDWGFPPDALGSERPRLDGVKIMASIRGVPRETDIKCRVMRWNVVQ